jgi:hypothetical protein
MHTHQRVSFAACGQAGVELPVAGIADGVYNMTAALGPPYSAGAWVAFAKRSPARRPALEVRHDRAAVTATTSGRAATPMVSTGPSAGLCRPPGRWPQSASGRAEGDRGRAAGAS